MATAPTLVSLDDYMRTSYRPDCDYVDGAIEVRNMGRYEHGRLQGLLTIWFGNHERRWGVRVVPELRTRVSATRVRIPDVCLLRDDAPREELTVTPPLLCVEVLSPDDRLPRTVKIMEEYAAMGVENLWILDPLERVGYVYSSGTLRLVEDRLAISGTEIFVDLPSLFYGLD